MRIYVYLALFLLVLIAPFGLRMAMVTTEAARSSAEVAGRLVIVTPHNQDIRREFERAFNRWHIERFGKTVTIDYRTPGGAGDIKRMLENIYGAMRDKDRKLPAESQVNADIHMVWGGGDFYFNNELKPLGIFQPLQIDPSLLSATFPEPALAGVRLYDHTVGKDGSIVPPTWIGVCLSSFGIVYNPDIYRSLQLDPPNQWGDLTNPRLAGMIALADPSHSGSAAVAYMMVLQRRMADAEEDFLRANPNLSRADVRKAPGYSDAISAGWKRGMSELLLIAANARYFTDSASQVPNDVGNGEAAAGMAIDFYGRVVQESVGDHRCKFVSPPAATAITPDPIAILYGVKGQEQLLARRFIEFQLSPEGQRLWILKPGVLGGPEQRSLRRPPIRRDVYADRTNWADDVNPYAEAGGFNQRGEWMALFGDTRPLWAAAWIDSREHLKSAYHEILVMSDPLRRQRLIDDLANLPITMKDVSDLRDERRRREDSGDADEWKARKRIEWANRFRAHYASVADKADN